MNAAVAAPARSAGSGTGRPSTCDPHIMNRAAGLRSVGPLHTCSSSCRRSAFLSSDRWPSDIRPLGIYPYSRGYTRCTRSDSVGAWPTYPCANRACISGSCHACGVHVPTIDRSWQHVHPGRHRSAHGRPDCTPPTYFGMGRVQLDLQMELVTIKVPTGFAGNGS